MHYIYIRIKKDKKERLPRKCFWRCWDFGLYCLFVFVEGEVRFQVMVLYI